MSPCSRRGRLQDCLFSQQGVPTGSSSDPQRDRKLLVVVALQTSQRQGFACNQSDLSTTRVRQQVKQPFNNKGSTSTRVHINQCDLSTTRARQQVKQPFNNQGSKSIEATFQQQGFDCDLINLSTTRVRRKLE